MSEFCHPTGAFIRCDRAFSEELAEPCWYYIIDGRDLVQGSLILKGSFRPDRPRPLFDRCDAARISTAMGDDGLPIVREQVVPIDEVPADVMAAFVKWKLLGEPDAEEA